jgi:hypothetical protein
MVLIIILGSQMTSWANHTAILVPSPEDLVLEWNRILIKTILNSAVQTATVVPTASVR